MKYNILIYGLVILLFTGCQSNHTQKSTHHETEIGTTLGSSEKLDSTVELDLKMANKLSQLAFKCIDQEYPNKLGQVLGNESYLKGPQELHPVFYGCFDWHSAVHGHWTLIKLLKEFPNLDNRDAIIRKIDQNITADNIAIEVAYFDDKYNKNYERTYGWAWLLKLAEEMYTWDDPNGVKWYDTMMPLIDLIIEKYQEFLHKLNYPIRVGEHTNTAFGISFAYDYATMVNHPQLLQLIESRAHSYYEADQNCPISWEPSGFDFLSPCIQEAEIMAKVMERSIYEDWLFNFIPELTNSTLQPAVASDLTDGKLVHIVGLNFSRAWCLYNMARSTERQELAGLADTHIAASIDQVVNGDYAGEHWLASFAVMAMSSR